MNEDDDSLAINAHKLAFYTSPLYQYKDGRVGTVKWLDDILKWSVQGARQRSMFGIFTVHGTMEQFSVADTEVRAWTRKTR